MKNWYTLALLLITIVSFGQNPNPIMAAKDTGPTIEFGIRVEDQDKTVTGIAPRQGTNEIDKKSIMQVSLGKAKEAVLYWSAPDFEECSGKNTYPSAVKGAEVPYGLFDWGYRNPKPIDGEEEIAFLNGGGTYAYTLQCYNYRLGQKVDMVQARIEGIKNATKDPEDILNMRLCTVKKDDSLPKDCNSALTIENDEQVDLMWGVSPQAASDPNVICEADSIYDVKWDGDLKVNKDNTLGIVTTSNLKKPETKYIITCKYKDKDISYSKEAYVYVSNPSEEAYDPSQYQTSKNVFTVVNDGVDTSNKRIFKTFEYSYECEGKSVIKDKTLNGIVTNDKIPADTKCVLTNNSNVFGYNFDGYTFCANKKTNKELDDCHKKAKVVSSKTIDLTGKEADRFDIRWHYTQQENIDTSNGENIESESGWVDNNDKEVVNNGSNITIEKPVTNNSSTAQIIWTMVKKYAPLAIFIILLIALIYAAVLLVPQSTITITSEANKIPLDTRMIIDTNLVSPDPANNLIPGQLIKLNTLIYQDIKATGEMNNGSKAGGILTISNKTDQEVPIAPQARFISQEGVVFRSVAVAIIPAKGSVNLSVTAETPGKIGNVGIGKFQVPDLPNASEYVDAEAKKPLSGGIDEISHFITDKDLQFDDLEMAKNLYDRAVMELKEKMPPNSNFVPLKIEGVKPTYEPDKKIGDQTEDFKVAAKSLFEFFVYDNKQVNDMASGNLQKMLPAGQAILDNGLTKMQMNVLNQDPKTGKATLEFKTDAISAPNYDIATIKKQIAGKNTETAQSILSADKRIKSIGVNNWPASLKNITKIPARIKIEIKW